MLPNIKAYLSGQPMSGLSGRVFDQLKMAKSMIPMQQMNIGIQQSQIQPLDVPPLSQVPIDQNKLAEGDSLVESIDLNQLISK